MYQTQSETSKAAYNLSDRRSMSSKILSFVDNSAIGKTIDEVSEHFKIMTGTASARIRELESDGIIIKTKRTRKTRKNRDANIYVTKRHFFDGMGRADVRESRADELDRLRRENKQMRKYLEMIVNSKPFFIESSPYQLVNLAKKGLE